MYLCWMCIEIRNCLIVVLNMYLYKMYIEIVSFCLKMYLSQLYCLYIYIEREIVLYCINMYQNFYIRIVLYQYLSDIHSIYVSILGILKYIVLYQYVLIHMEVVLICE